jgi:hypothetical protein
MELARSETFASTFDKPATEQTVAAKIEKDSAGPAEAEESAGGGTVNGPGTALGRAAAVFFHEVVPQAGRPAPAQKTKAKRLPR